MECTFSRCVWSEFEANLIHNLWTGNSVSSCLKNWCLKGEVKHTRSLPIMVLWFIWKAINKSYFDDLVLTPFHVASLSLGLLSSFHQDKIVVRIRPVVEEVIDKSYPWVYFDGSTVGDPKICGVGGFLFISDENFFTFKVGLGIGTNNYAELLGLKLLLTLSLDNNFKKLQIFCDSQLVINWVSGKYRVQIVQLAQIFIEVNRLDDMFDSVDFLHIYHECNTLANILAKDGANVLSGS